MAEQVLAAVRTAPGTTEMREFPMPDIAGRRRAAQDRGRRHLRHRREDVPQAHDRRPGDHGPRERRHRGQGRREVVEDRTAWREGDRIFVEHYVGCMHCEWCRLGEYRHCELTDWRTNPDARRYGYTSSNNPGTAVGRLRPVHVPAVERGDPQGARRRLRRAGRPGHAAVQRHRVGAQRRQGRQRLHRPHPGPRAAGPVAGRRLQAGRRLADRRHRHHPRRDAAAAVPGPRRRRRHRRPAARTRSTGSWSSPAARASTSSSTARPAPGTAPVLLGIDALEAPRGDHGHPGRGGGVPRLPAQEDDREVHHARPAPAGTATAPSSWRSSSWPRGRFPLERLATHRFALADVDHAIRTLAGETGEDAIHISLLPWGEDGVSAVRGNVVVTGIAARRPRRRRRPGRLGVATVHEAQGRTGPARPGAAARSTPARASPAPRSRSACRPATTG